MRVNKYFLSLYIESLILPNQTQQSDTVSRVVIGVYYESNWSIMHSLCIKRWD